MKKSLIFCLLTLLFSLFFACQNEAKSSKMSPMKSEAGANKAANGSTGMAGMSGMAGNQVANGKNSGKQDILDGKDASSPSRRKTPDKIIKTAHVEMEVENFEVATQEIRQLVKKWDAYSSNETSTNEHHRISGQISIRLSPTNFDVLVKEMGDLAKIINRKQISAVDVSEEFFDLETRLKTKRAVEERYLSILKEAKTIEEILLVETELRKIREEIEAKEGRMRFLTDQVQYSTIHLNYYQRIIHQKSPYKKPGFFSRISEGIVAGWNGILEFVVAMSYVWPILLALALFFFFFIRFLRRGSNKNSNKQTQSNHLKKGVPPLPPNEKENKG